MVAAATASDTSPLAASDTSPEPAAAGGGVAAGCQSPSIRRRVQ
jgi:hypothetical protein